MRRWVRERRAYVCEVCGRSGLRAWIYHDMLSPGGDENGRRFIG